MEIPPVGIPVPACCRSNWIMFSPARKFSLMSDPCTTTWFDCDGIAESDHGCVQQDHGDGHGDHQFDQGKARDCFL